MMAKKSFWKLPAVMKKLIFLLCFITAGFNLWAESVFTLSLKKDIAISTLALGLFLSHYLIDNREGLPNNLDRNNVNVFDRGLMFPHNTSFNTTKNILGYGLQVLPIITPLALAGLDIRNRDTISIWLTYGVMYAQAMLLTQGTRRWLGVLVDRYRPRDYFLDVIVYPICNRSFPSGTTAYAFMPAAFFSVTFSAEFPNSPWRIPIIVGTHTLAASVGVFRILSGHHFLTDVLAGAVIGSFFGWLIPTVHIRANGDNRFSFRFTGNGAVMSLSF